MKKYWIIILTFVAMLTVLGYTSAMTEGTFQRE